MCYEEGVVDINILVGDDNFGVEKSPKKNENWYATKRRERNHREVLGRGLGVGLWFHPFLGKWRVFFIHPLWGMRTKLILLNIHPRILIYKPYIIFTKNNGPYFILIYLTCNGIVYFSWTLRYLKFLCQTNLILPKLCRTSFFKCTMVPPPLPPWPTWCAGPWTWVTRLPYAH